MSRKFKKSSVEETGVFQQAFTLKFRLLSSQFTSERLKAIGRRLPLRAPPARARRTSARSSRNVGSSHFSHASVARPALAVYFSVITINALVTLAPFFPAPPLPP